MRCGFTAFIFVFFVLVLSAEAQPPAPLQSEVSFRLNQLKEKKHDAWVALEHAWSDSSPRVKLKEVATLLFAKDVFLPGISEVLTQTLASDLTENPLEGVLDFKIELLGVNNEANHGSRLAFTCSVGIDEEGIDLFHCTQIESDFSRPLSDWLKPDKIDRDGILHLATDPDPRNAPLLHELISKFKQVAKQNTLYLKAERQAMGVLF